MNSFNILNRIATLALLICLSLACWKITQLGHKDEKHQNPIVSVTEVLDLNHLY